MTEQAFNALVEAAAAPYRHSGRYAWHFARGKLLRDPVFRFLLRSGVLPPAGLLFDLGCGQGVLMALLQAARTWYAEGNWPLEWPAPPHGLELHGVELRRQRAAVARHALGCGAVVAEGDIRHAHLSPCEVIVILDVLLYLNKADQRLVLARCAAALRPGGVLVLREADAAAGLPFQITRWTERVACWSRGQLRQPLNYRPAPEWEALLEASGFTVETTPMSEGTPFGNVLFVASRG
jgi:SAM-dependent methyltransferase